MNYVSTIKHEAGRCVACGLCLPHCPTYLKLRDEAESPRGRISLMLALANGDLTLTAKLESHLDRCLACRACEKVCPSNVAYGLLIDSARALIKTSRPSGQSHRSMREKLLDRLTNSPGNTRAFGKILRLYQLSGIQRLVRASRILKFFGLAELEANLPPLVPQKAFKESYPVQGKPIGHIALFTGCVASITDRQTLFATIRLLNFLRYEVHIPPAQVCCGALHQHDGRWDHATALMHKNIQAFTADRYDFIIHTASGCGASLSEYANHLNGDEAAKRFANKVRDIGEFLAKAAWPSNLSFKPLNQRIAVHDPCTLSHVLRQQDKPYALLGKIPGAEIFPLPENHLCCGAAGTYHLSQPEIAGKLRADKLAHLKQLAPALLATSNIGCAMYLAAGIRKTGLKIEVVHPVVLLERQLPMTDNEQ